MEKKGVVKRTYGGKAEIFIERDSACGENCAACGICKGMKEMTVVVPNRKGLKSNDKVILVTDDKRFLLRSMTGYLSLTLLLIIGGALGNITFGDWGAFCGAVIFVGIGVLILRKIMKKELGVEVRRIED